MDFETVFAEELQRIQKTPGKQGVTKDNLISLSISGGGIRSASLGLGVIHGLVAHNKLPEIDYLSTVSGGGFIGSALTWALYKNKDKGESILTSKDFPLGRAGSGSTNSSVNNALNYMRQQANYICPGKGIDLLSALGVVLRGMILGIIVYFPLLALLLYVTRPWELGSLYLDIAAGSGAAFIAASIFFSLLTYFSYRFYFDKNKPNSATLAYKLRNACQKIGGKLLIIAILFLSLWSLKLVTNFLDSLSIKTLTASLSTAVGYLTFVGNLGTKKKSGLGNLLALIAAALFIYGLLLFAYFIAQSYQPVLWIIVATSIVVGFLSNLNMVGLHRMYRDRLMETFLPNTDVIETQEWNLATESNQAPMQDMCDSKTPGPYHMCCGTVNLKNSNNSKVCGRLGDSFILSPLYCGSTATGWQKTKEFMKGGLNLPTAMAISGAEANPNAAISGSGLTASPIISFIMTLLNIRLGYWAPNPNHPRARKGWTANFFLPGLQDLLGYGYRDDSAFLELTDGVNFENLSLYEMIRRKPKIAIVSDGGADAADTFSSLGNAIEKVRVDFGTTILFENPDYDLKWLVTGSGNSGPFETQFSTAKRGFAIGSIYYPDGTKGTLFYIKATLTDNLPADIYGYQSTHPTFPNESTANQFFTETQFEAYRELGYRISSDLLSQLDDNWNLNLRK